MIRLVYFLPTSPLPRATTAWLPLRVEPRAVPSPWESLLWAGAAPETWRSKSPRRQLLQLKQGWSAPKTWRQLSPRGQLLQLLEVLEL